MKLNYNREEIEEKYDEQVEMRLKKYEQFIQDAINKKNDFLEKMVNTDMDYFIENYPVIMRYILYKIEYEESLDEIPDTYEEVLSGDYDALPLDGSFYGYITELCDLKSMRVNDYSFFFYRFLYEVLLNNELDPDFSNLDILMKEYNHDTKKYINNYYKYLNNEICGYGRLIDIVKEINGLTKEYCIEVKTRCVNRVGYDYRTCKLSEIFIRNIVLQIIDNENNCREDIKRGFKIAIMNYKLKNKAK